jgi:hypothetical protein
VAHVADGRCDLSERGREVRLAVASGSWLSAARAEHGDDGPYPHASRNGPLSTQIEASLQSGLPYGAERGADRTQARPVGIVDIQPPASITAGAGALMSKAFSMVARFMRAAQTTVLHLLTAP